MLQLLKRRKGNDMDVYIGLDVSLASTAVCVLDEKGGIVTEARVASRPIADFVHAQAAFGENRSEAGPTVAMAAQGLAVRRLRRPC